MKRIIWLCIAAILGVAAVSCSNVTGCFNPTGYCGSSTPDPDRIGGGRWFLSTDADSRFAYYYQQCAKNETLQGTALTDCARSGIKQDAHHTCVQYYKPPIRPKDDAEAAYREQNYQQCKAGVLDQHGI